MSRKHFCAVSGSSCSNVGEHFWFVWVMTNVSAQSQPLMDSTVLSVGSVTAWLMHGFAFTITVLSFWSWRDGAAIEQLLWLHTSLAENWSSVPSILAGQLTTACNSYPRRSNTFFCPVGPAHSCTYTHMHTIFKIPFFLSFKCQVYHLYVLNHNYQSHFFFSSSSSWHTHT